MIPSAAGESPGPKGVAFEKEDPNSGILGRNYPIGWWNTSIPDAGVNNASAQATVWYPATISGDRTPPDLSGAPYTTMIWAPGFSANRLNYIPYLVSMAQLGMVVIGVDFDLRQPIQYAEPHEQANHTYVAAMWALAQNLSSGSKLEMMVDGARFVMSGHSMGGRVASLAVGRHSIFRAAVPIAPAIDAWPYYQPPPSPQDSISRFNGPVLIPIGDADTSTPYGYNALRLYNASNCPKQMLLVKGADHGFIQPGTLDLLIEYSLLFYRYHLLGDASVYDGLYGSGPKDDLNSGKLSQYLACPPSGGGSGVATLEVSPKQATVAADSTLQLTAIGKDAQGNPVPVTPAWTASMGNVDQSGRYSPGPLGKDVVSASVANLSASASIDVVPGKVASAALSPASVRLEIGRSVRFTASASDSKGNPVPGIAVSLSAVGGVGSIDQSGIFAGQVAGTGSIVATVSGNGGSAQATASVEVTSAPPPPLPAEPKVATATISPISIKMEVGESATFTAVGLDPSGVPVVNTSVSWSVEGGLGTISGSGWFVAARVGTGTVRAEVTGGGGHASAVASISVNPVSSGGDNGSEGDGGGASVSPSAGTEILSTLGLIAMLIAAAAGGTLAVVATRSRKRRSSPDAAETWWQESYPPQTTAPDSPYRRD